MTQTVEVPGVGDLEFPDGMSQADMAAAIQKNFPQIHQEQKAAAWGPSSRFDQLSTWDKAKGFARDVVTRGGDDLDSIRNALQGEFRGAITKPAVGIAQSWAHTPDAVAAAVPGGALIKSAVGAVLGTGAQADEFVRQREAKIQAERAARGETGTDWWETAGSVMSPINYLAPGGAGKNALARIGLAARSGALAAATQPVTSGESFGGEKTKQVGLGAVTAAAVGTAGEVVGALAKPIKAGIDGIKRWLGAEMPSSLQSAAVHKVLETFGRDEAAGGPTLTDVMDVLNTARAAGKPMTLADTGGANVNALAGYVTRQPGESTSTARTLLASRDAGAAARLSKDITENVTSGPTMKQTADALTQARSAAAKPLYEEAMKAGEVSSPRIQQFLDDPIVKQGLRKGLEVQRLEALAKGETFNLADYAIQGAAQDGEPIVGQAPNMRLLDSTKRGLDEILEGYRDKTTGRLVLDQRGRAIDSVRRAFVGELDRLNPSYAAARASWSGPSQSLDAMKAGSEIFNRKPEEVAETFGRLSPNDKEFYRLGVADKLRERIAKTGIGGDEAKKIIGNEWTKSQLRPIFGSQAEFDKFMNAATMESKMFDTAFRLKGGSQTAERTAADRAFGADVEGALYGVGATKNALTGNFLGAARDMWRMRQALGWRKNQALNAEIAKLLFDPALTQDALQASAGTRLLQNFPGPQTQNFLRQGALQDFLRQVQTRALPSAGGMLAPALLDPGTGQ